MHEVLVRETDFVWQGRDVRDTVVAGFGVPQPLARSQPIGRSLPSAQTVTLLARPAPVVSSRILMRSRGFLPLGVRWGYS